MKCNRCGQRLEDGSSVGERDTGVCDKCRAHLELRDAYVEASNARALELANCEASDPLRALAILQEIRDLFVGRDIDGWVDRSLRAARAHVMMQSQRHEEAVVELRALAREPNLDFGEYLLSQMNLAISLEKLERPTEALAELDAAISVAPRVNPAREFPVLALYAKMAERMGQTVPVVHLAAFLAATGAMGIDVAQALREGGIHHAVLNASEQLRVAQRRYGRFVAALRSVPAAQRDSMIDAYLEEESVGQFRELAEKARVRRGLS